MFKRDPFRFAACAPFSALGVAAFVIAMFISGQSARAANTPNNYTGSTTGSILTPTNWSLGHVPTVGEDAVFNNGTGIRTFNNGSLTVGSFNVTAAGTYTIRNATNNTTSTLTLGGTGATGNSVSGTAADLLFVAGGSTFTITGVNATAAIVNVVLGQTGSFNAAGTLNLSSVISDGGNNFGITKTGAGTLTLSGANTYGGGITLSTGTLNIANGGTSSTNSALGTGQFTINGGTITNNTSGTPITLATNNVQSWAGDFSFAGTSGTNDLNLGNGAVTLTGNRQITINGTTSSLTVGGAIGDGGSGFSLTKTTSGTGTLILTGNNTYSGVTTIGAGTINAAANGALGSGTTGTSSIAVNKGATLLLSNAGSTDRVKDTAAITLGGGVTVGTASIVRSGGGSEGSGSAVGLGALTLAANSSLNFGGASVGNGTLTFGGGNLATPFSPAGFTLSILGYDGVFGTTTPGVDGTNDRLIFSADQLSNLAQFSFINPNGLTGTYTADEIALGNGFFEIVPVPEPSTWAGAALAVVALGWSLLKKVGTRDSKVEDSIRVNSACLST